MAASRSNAASDPQRCSCRVRGAVTQQVNFVVAKKLNAHAVLPAQESGRLLFPGSRTARPTRRAGWGGRRHDVQARHQAAKRSHRPCVRAQPEASTRPTPATRHPNMAICSGEALAPKVCVPKPASASTTTGWPPAPAPAPSRVQNPPSPAHRLGRRWPKPTAAKPPAKRRKARPSTPGRPPWRAAAGHGFAAIAPARKPAALRWQPPANAAQGAPHLTAQGGDAATPIARPAKISGASIK